MTCCVAHRATADSPGFIAADTLMSNQGGWKTPSPVMKISDYGHTLVAFAGRASTSQRVDAVLRKCKTPGELKATLLKWMQEDDSESAALLINTDGDLSTINIDNLNDLDPSMNVFSIGSGSDLSQGYVGACEKIKGRVSPEDVVDSIQYASQYTTTVNDTINIVFLSPPAPKTVKRKPAKKKSKAKRKLK
jgi:ATP-dependent protease HslVU (ClpYQ) peptidase subunit